MTNKPPKLIIKFAPPTPNENSTDWLAEYAAQLYKMKLQYERKNRKSSNPQKGT